MPLASSWTFTGTPPPPLPLAPAYNRTYRAPCLVVVKVHEEAQIPPLLPRVHKFSAEQAAEVDIVAAAPPVPVGAPRAAPPVIAGARLNGAFGAGACHRMCDPGGGDCEDKCCFPAACG